MGQPAKVFIFLGSINAMISVILGAFGAHVLNGRLSTEMMDVYQTGVHYEFYHALGLILVGLVAYHLPQSNYIHWSGWLMFAGIVIFSGSLYILSLTGVRWLGAITPVGGTFFIISWILLAIGVLVA